MSDQSTASSVITYGSVSIDVAKLPQASVMAMLRRGVSHFLGSEQASKVTSFFDPDQENPPADTAEARAAKKAEFQADALEKLLAGTVGNSVRGPTVDPLTTHMRRIAKAEVTNILKANGVKFPAKAEDTIELPDGSKLTGTQLIDRRLAKEGERITKEAKKAMDDQAKKAAKAQEAAKTEGLAGL